MGDSQSAEGATAAYVADPKAHCMMSGVAYPLREGKPIVMTGQVNIVITPSPRVTSCNRWADKIVILEHGVLGHNMLQRSFIFAPAEVQGDHYQLGPKALCWYLQQRDTAALAPVHKETFGPTYDACQPGRGVPVEWFNSHQLRHILLHRVGMITTMAELATRTAYREVIVPGLCCFCRQPDTVRHAWHPLPSTHIVRHLLKGLCAWMQKPGTWTAKSKGTSKRRWGERVILWSGTWRPPRKASAKTT